MPKNFVEESSYRLAKRVNEMEIIIYTWRIVRVRSLSFVFLIVRATIPRSPSLLLSNVYRHAHSWMHKMAANKFQSNKHWSPTFEMNALKHT